MTRFMLDTNVCIDFARGRSHALLSRMEDRPSGSLIMSAVTFAELAGGARGDDSDQRKLEMLVRIVEPRPFDAVAALSYGTLVRAIGVRRNSFDRLIAAHAVALGTVLVTNNENDFADIPGLRVENWTLPLT